MLVLVLVSPEGEEAVLVLVLVVLLDELEVPPAGDSFTMVVLVSLLSPAGGLVTVVSFCSQPARSAAAARMPMYFFISSLELVMGWLGIG